MSRRAIRWEQMQARRYGAAIPQAQAQVQRLSIKPVQLGPAPSSLLPNARSQYELHEGLAGMVHDLLKKPVERSNARRLNRSQDRALLHPGLSREQTLEQYTALMEYVLLAELVADRVDRAMHAHHIQQLLTENERILQRLGSRVVSDSSVPSINELEAVIITRETARRALGRLDTIAPQADRWSERPWFWESRFWDVEYNQQQQMLRDRQSAFSRTGIVIPKPALVFQSDDIARIAATLGCAVVH